MISAVIAFWSCSDEADKLLAECIERLRVDEVILIVNEPNANGEPQLSKHWNRGLRLAHGDCICVVNNDAMLIEGTLADLYQPDAITSPMINGVVQPFWGAFCCIPSSIYREHGGFDEQFTGYWEDLDFACSMYTKGIPLRCVPRVRVSHVFGRTLMKHLGAKRLHDENKERFKAKWGRVIDIQELWTAA